MGPPSYMRTVVYRNVVMRRMTVFTEFLNVFTALWCTGTGASDIRHKSRKTHNSLLVGN